MKCLAVNTATTTLSIALVDGDKTLHSFETSETRDQGNLILKHMQEGLEKNGLTFADVDLLAVVTGPGSFTGIRIGLAAMRGIGLAAGKPVAGISSFDLFAQEGGVNLVAVESWREELYFRLTGPKGESLVPPVNESPEAFAERVKNIPGPIIISGDAAKKIAPLLPGATVYAESANAIKAAEIALNRWNSNKTAVEKPVPFYLRPADITVPKKRDNSL